MDADEYDDPPEPEQCEECTGQSSRICTQCSRRICRACARHHRMGLVFYEDLPEADQPPWCRRLTVAERRAIDLLPRSRSEVDEDTRRSTVYTRLLAEHYVRWTDAGILVHFGRVHVERTCGKWVTSAIALDLRPTYWRYALRLRPPRHSA